jgi:hypothetical protein
MDTSNQAIVKAVRRLTIAVWALVIVVAVLVAIYLVAYVPWIKLSWNNREISSESPSSSSLRSLPQYERFYDLPLDKQIDAASVIALAQYQKEGEKLKCVVSEILKRSPNTEFYFKVGDEYPQCSRYPKANESYGDGQIMFFVGSPAQFRYSTSFEGDRLTGLGDMPIALLRAKIKGEAK